MAYEESLRSISLPANADLSAKQYYFVRAANASGQAQVAVAADGGDAIGVLQNTPSAQGEVATVGYSGVTKVVAGDAITAGAAVASDTNGKAVTAATGDFRLGIALVTAAANDIIPVLLLAKGTT